MSDRSDLPVDSPSAGAGVLSDVALPALLVLAGSLAVVALRPGLPLDETRYLEVAREIGRHGWLVLHLAGEPYADKPPLLFWIGAALAQLGVPLSMGMRAVPGVASALLVWIAGLTGRRLGVRGAGWLQAAMLMPLLYSQVLLVDTLLACTVWYALAAWVRGKDGRAALGLAAAFLTKGPVAVLHFLPLAWALAPARPRAVWGRLALVVLAGVAALAAWALAAARAGGEEFAHDLLVTQTFGRVQTSFAHARGPLYYLPVLLLGALPALPLLRRLPRSPGLRRLPIALVAVVLAFMAISGKQPHYLLPLVPALALWAADSRARGTSGLRSAGLVPLVIGFAAVAAVPFVQRFLDLNGYAPKVEALFQDSAWWVLLAIGCAVALVCAVALFRRRDPLPAAVVGTLALLLPMQLAWGRLVFPEQLVPALPRDPSVPVATYHFNQAGFQYWLLGREDVDRLQGSETLVPWCRAHPGGFVLREEGRELGAAEELLTDIAHDVSRGEAVVLSRVSR